MKMSKTRKNDTIPMPKRILTHFDPAYVDEDDMIAVEVKDVSTLEEAIGVIEKPPNRYASYSLLMVSNFFIFHFFQIYLYIF